MLPQLAPLDDEKLPRTWDSWMGRSDQVKLVTKVGMKGWAENQSAETGV